MLSSKLITNFILKVKKNMKSDFKCIESSDLPGVIVLGLVFWICYYITIYQKNINLKLKK